MYESLWCEDYKWFWWQKSTRLRQDANEIAAEVSSIYCFRYCKMINDSMNKCAFPDSLKFAEVSSLFKKKDTLNKGNYRPVSILVALSKIYEKAVGVQLTGYFNSIFSILLSAFRKGYSWQSALLNMIEKFKSALDKGELVACISVDISKAFDCLPHYLTICKLFSYGLSREAAHLLLVICFNGNKELRLVTLKANGVK